MNDNITVSELIRQGEAQLLPLVNARLDAELLLCNVMQVDRSKLYASPETRIAPEVIKEYKNLVDTRRTGIPLAYLTGIKEFWSLEFTVNEYTLIPRPETEYLVEMALEIIPHESCMTVADLGTGSGAIAIAIASERPRSNIIATDISKQAIDIARTNAIRHGVKNINFFVCDWLENLQGTFDLIVSNPPYIKNSDNHLNGDGIKYEPELALCGGIDGMDAIRIIVQNSVNHLNNNARLIIEHGHDQGKNVRSIFSETGFTDIQTFSDYAGMERITSGICRHE